MPEQACRFGSHEGLLGVLASAGEGARRPSVGVLFSNVGLNHHVGPNRKWVEVARHLADAGFPSLRFDLSGRGDSEARADSRSEGERAVLDTTEAMDFLGARTKLERFVLVANCSGVDSQHAAMVRDARVVGAVAIDGYAYRNFGYWVRRQLNLLQPERWRRRARLRRLGGAAAWRKAAGAEAVWVRDIPSREAYGRDLDRLCARGVRQLLLFTGGADLVYNHRGQFEAVFGARRVEVEFYRAADHLFSVATDRRWLVERTASWMARSFGAASA